ncbi:hypothetical protein [Mycobacterium sp. 155]|uniref:hypothetical protein n=1 Tax=Mycobacterium sp. 155 TaxID=1157943 RepID=UPI000377A185|nr:hypothetical protein [Mycobacterium sp. 155]
MVATNNKSRVVARFVVAPVAAASILGGAALGLAAGANADTGSSDQSHGSYSMDYRHDSDDYRGHRDWGFRGFWPWHHWDNSFRGDYRS